MFRCSKGYYFISVSLPKVEYNNETNVISVNEETKISLNVLCKPIATSFAIFNEKTILVDPCEEEELLSSGMFCIVISDNELCSIHKPGSLYN